MIMVGYRFVYDLKTVSYFIIREKIKHHTNRFTWKQSVSQVGTPFRSQSRHAVVWVESINVYHQICKSELIVQCMENIKLFFPFYECVLSWNPVEVAPSKINLHPISVASCPSWVEWCVCIAEVMGSSSMETWMFF